MCVAGGRAFAEGISKVNQKAAAIPAREGAYKTGIAGDVQKIKDFEADQKAGVPFRNALAPTAPPDTTATTAPPKPPQPAGETGINRTVVSGVSNPDFMNDLLVPRNRVRGRAL